MELRAASCFAVVVFGVAVDALREACWVLRRVERDGARYSRTSASDIIVMS